MTFYLDGFAFVPCVVAQIDHKPVVRARPL